VKGRRNPSVRSEGYVDSRYGIVTVGITRLHFTLSTTRHGLESSTSWSLTIYRRRRTRRRPTAGQAGLSAASM